MGQPLPTVIGMALPALGVGCSGHAKEGNREHSPGDGGHAESAACFLECSPASRMVVRTSAERRDEEHGFESVRRADDSAGVSEPTHVASVADRDLGVALVG